MKGKCMQLVTGQRVKATVPFRDGVPFALSDALVHYASLRCTFFSIGIFFGLFF